MRIISRKTLINYLLKYPETEQTLKSWYDEALNKVGGFPKILTHEDYYVTAKLLKAGYNICYVADAVIEHSHNYGIVKEFRRYFDAGYVRAENP